MRSPHVYVEVGENKYTSTPRVVLIYVTEHRVLVFIFLYVVRNTFAPAY
jgi:hypothetical protein